MSGAGADLEKGLRRVGRGFDKRVRGMAEDPERALYAAATMGGSEVIAATGEEIGRNRASLEPAPAPGPIPVMPVMDSEEIKRVRRRYAAQQMRRGGRESTKLISDKLGAG